MTELPSILVTDGWETDQNNALVEVVIPSTVNTLNVPRKVTFLGETLNWIPSTAAALQEFEAPNMTALSTKLFQAFTALTSISLPKLETIATSGSGGTFYGCTGLTSISLPSLISFSTSGSNNHCGTFYGCTGLTSVSLPSLVSIQSDHANYRSGIFCGCTGLTSITLPSLKTIVSYGGGGQHTGTFYNCTSLETVVMPVLESDSANNNGQTFKNCTSLESVQLGSEGHAVTSLGSYMFAGCTQAGLTITVYTSGGVALSGEPWGATSATIVYEEA